MKTVKDVIEALQKMDPALPVYYAIDDEGNSYHQVSYLPGAYYSDEAGERSLDTVYPNFDEWAESTYFETEEEEQEARKNFQTNIVLLN